jgi:hypothetical protein
VRPAKSQSACCCQPWVQRPHSLMTWWDMEKFTAATFYGIGHYLAEVKRNFEGRFSLETQAEPGAHERGKGGKNLRFIQSECAKLGLSVSTKCIDLYFEKDQAGMTVGEIVELLNQLERTIRWEMEEKLFMFIPSDRAGYYDQPELFGKDVNKRFPTIQFDMIEAGNCYAAGRGTAVVFHLMRIMEVGVQEFGKKLSVALVAHKNWQNILDEMNKAIKALPPLILIRSNSRKPRQTSTP